MISVNKSRIILILATLGVFLQVAGANWDITLHLTRPGEREGNRLLLDAETFFSPSHIFLYSGVVLTTIAAVSCVVMLVLYYKKKTSLLSTKTSLPSFTASFRLLILGCGLQLVAGPFDFWWHNAIGLDGLLSPPHLLLIVGMFVNALAVTIGLTRIIKFFLPISSSSYLDLPSSSTKLKIQSKLIAVIVRNNIILRMALVTAFAALWLSATWLAYAFVLPLSQGERFNFNSNPIIAVIISIIVLPLISSTVFVTASRTIGGIRGKYGGASAVALLVLGTNIFANIIPYEQLVAFVPWYLLILIPAVIISDIILNNQRTTVGGSKQRSGNMVTNNAGLITMGAIIGSIFYLFNFPMISLTFAVSLGTPIPLIMRDEMSNFINTFSSVIFITIIPGSLVGIIGVFMISNKIKEISFSERKNFIIPILSRGNW